MHNSTAVIAFVLMMCLQWAPVNAQTVSVPAGTFIMGSSTGEGDEAPPHDVSVSGFVIDKCEVTRAQYDSCVRAGACTPAHYDDGTCLMWSVDGIRKVRVPSQYQHPDYPVVCVDWQQARAYCRHKGMRLPTEAQWEYAATAGSGAAAGSGVPVSAPLSHPQQCASSSLYPSGLADMLGNVWEWTADRYQRDYYRVHETQNPSGPDVGRYRVIRGGGWYSSRGQMRPQERQLFVPEYGEVSLGFRCVK